MKAYLILQDGTVFTGTSIGSTREMMSEIVFDTSMTGYLEVLTDPSYAGQAVVMTYPLIGNYGINYDDMESQRAWVDGFIVRELSRMPSNFRCQGTIQEFLEKQEITGICGIDTRALTRHLRAQGTMNGMITTNGDFDLNEVCERLNAYVPAEGVKRTTCEQAHEAAPAPVVVEGFDYLKLAMPQNGAGKRVALLDLGVKKQVIECLTTRGCQVDIYPAGTKAEEILAADPDGILLSNGPGNPREYTEIIEEVRKMYESDVPVFAIGLGHQLMALATGADTCRLKYGHRGGNHPVKDLETGRVYITSQNHGYEVKADSLNPAVAQEAFVNVNDGTNEGLRYVGKNILTVQFYPASGCNEQDTGMLFEHFIQMMEEGKKNA